MRIVKKIFLVDDDTDDQEFFAEAISGLKNISLSGVANNGRKALDVLNNSTLLPDFIFLDFNMPLMNGIECLREIKKFPRTKDIPVFMLSSAIEQAELSRELGAKGFIKKCDDITVFREELDRVINRGITVKYIITDQTKSPSFIKKQVMKKNQKQIATNNQEDGDSEVYILYPENAIADISLQKKQTQNTGFETALKAKELHTIISISEPSSK